MSSNVKLVSAATASEHEKLEEPTVLTVDPDLDDSDSALGGSVAGSYSASLTSSVLNYKYENGRRYHAFREGSYFLPNDEVEQQRLALFHHIFLMVNGGDLYCAPLKESSKLNRALDLGTGTGIWAFEFADEFPACMVLGNDLSAIQPTWVPPNCKFYIEDIEDQWNYTLDERFDYIHGRCLDGCISDYKTLFRQAYDNLNPGGWFEMQEVGTRLSSDDGTSELVNHWADWVEKVHEASERFKKPLGIVFDLRSWMEEAGFVNIKEKSVKVPIGPWAKDKVYKQLGRFFLAAIMDSVEPTTLALFTRVLGYSAEEAQITIANVKSDLLKRGVHIWVPIRFVYGQKPE